MTRLHDYLIVFKGMITRATGTFRLYRVVSREPGFPICPACHSELHHTEWRMRYYYLNQEKVAFEVRQFKCTGTHCPHRWHRELPDCTLPYQHPDIDAVEALYFSEKPSSPDVAPGAGAGEEAPASSERSREKRDGCEEGGQPASRWRAWLRKFIPGCKKAFVSLKLRGWGGEKMRRELDELIELDPATAPPGWLKRFVQRFVESGVYISHRFLFFVR